MTLEVDDRRVVARRDAADDDAGDALAGREHHLAVDERRRGDHAGRVAHRGEDLVGVADRARVRDHHDVRVEPEDTVAQILLEPGHHREHDVERHDADHDADDGDHRDEGNERLFAACAQVAQADHQLVTHGSRFSAARGAVVERE